MKKIKVLLVSSLLLLFFACGNINSNSNELIEELNEREVSIYTGQSSGDSKEIESYQANVKSYYSNNRTGVDMEPQQEYRLSMKVIGDRVYSRLDFESENFPDQRARSIVSNDNEAVVMFSDNGDIEARFPVDKSSDRQLLDNSKLSSLGRVDIDNILKEAKRLSFDIQDDTPGALMVNIPASTFQSQTNGYGFESKVVSCKLNFDTEKDILHSTEMELIESDGTSIEIETHPLYKEQDGLMVKVGQVQVINNKPNIDMSDLESVVQEYESIEDIPEISEEELTALQESGEVSLEETELLLGDPSNPDFQETFVELYEDVEVNTLSDSIFKIVLEG